MTMTYAERNKKVWKLSRATGGERVSKKVRQQASARRVAARALR